MSACTFFGHRDCSDEIETVLYGCIEKLICENNVDVFYVGNQGNFDAIVLNALKRLKQKYTHIKCYVVLAYLPSEKTSFDFVSETIYPQGIENIPPRFAICFRNKWMVKKSDFVVGYVRYSVGGAYKSFELARKQNKNVINLYD